MSTFFQHLIIHIHMYLYLFTLYKLQLILDCCNGFFASFAILQP